MAVTIGDAWIGPNYPVTQVFGANPATYAPYGLQGHEGVDFGLPNGTPVIAVEAGIVLRVGPLPGWLNYGVFVEIWHDQEPGQKFATLYAHLASAAVATGDRVIKAQLLGLSNNTGNSSGPHLHFGLCYTDPQGVRLNQGNGYKGWLDADNRAIATWVITNPIAPAVPPPVDPCQPIRADLAAAKAQLAAVSAQLAAMTANLAADTAQLQKWEDWYAARPR
jgi:murein DD-endopeptidase MepM/ murein hydrolase activator NlpD